MSSVGFPSGGALRGEASEAATGVDRARHLRIPSEGVFGAWRALCEGRWSIVESGERDGRRFLVARPDAPLHDREPLASAGAAGRPPPGHPRRLSAQESRVLVALAKGHSNKLIAYELDLATSTVGTLLARAARKLGCQNRIALARAGNALTHQPTGKSSVEGPGEP